MFIAALFTIAKTWKRHKSPSVDEWIKKMWYTCVCVCARAHVCVYIYNQILLSSHKKEESLAICDNMDETRRHYPK